MHAPVWHIGLFGTLRLTDPRQQQPAIVRFRTQRSATLLACLALSAEPVRRETIADLLWPDSPPELGRSRLRQELATLRRQLEPAPLPSGSVLETIGNDKIGLNKAAVRTDVAQFEQLCRTAERAKERGDTAQAIAAWQQAIALQGDAELLTDQYAAFFLGHRERLRVLQENAQDQLIGLGAAAAADLPAMAVSSDSDESETAESSVTETRASSGLPMTLTRFFGRETEIACLRDLLQSPTEVRLISLIGPGGSGKTRLVIEGLRAASEKDSVSIAGFVALANLLPGSSLVTLQQAVWDAIRHPAAASTLSASRDNIVHRLEACARNRKSVVLVWDNAEHVTEGVGALCAALQSAVPSLVCVVTSRTRLLADGEHEIPVPPLPLPEAAARRADLVLVPSVALFCERARTLRPDFALTERNAENIVSICRLLEGFPLALELAAARTYTLGVGQIYAQLKDDPLLRLSGSVARTDVQERHRTLAAAIEWSLNLLSQPTGELFAALSVFLGSFTADSVVEIFGGDHRQVVEGLTLLRLHSLILPAEPLSASDSPRYRLLDTLREAGRVRQSDASQNRMHRRHAAYFLQQAEARLPPDEVTGRDDYLAFTQSEEANLQAALQWARQNDPACLARLVIALCSSWQTFGRFDEMRLWCESAAAVCLKDPAWGRLLSYAALGAFHQGDFSLAGERGRQAQIWCDTHGDAYGAALAVQVQGSAVNYQGQADTAREAFTDALQRFRRTGSRRSEANVLLSLGMADSSVARYEAARPYYEAALSIARDVRDDVLAATLLVFLTDWYNCTDRFAEAEIYARECLEIVTRLHLEHTHCLLSYCQCVYLTETGQFDAALEAGAVSFSQARRLHIGWVQPFTTEALAQLAAAQNQWERAAALFGVADALRAATSAPVPPAYQPRRERYLSATRAALGRRFSPRHRSLQTKSVEAQIAFVHHPKK